MKVLVFGLSGQYGGVESFIASQVSALYNFDSSFSFDYVVFDGIPSYFEKLQVRSDVNFHVIPSRWLHPIKYMRALKRIFDENEYDLLWYNVCTLSDISLLKYAYVHHVSCVVHSHNSENMGNWVNSLLHRIHRQFISGCSVGYLACSDEAGRFMFPDWGSGRHGETVVPNAIDVAHFSFSAGARQAMRKRMGISDQEILIGNVGRLHFQKNQLFLLDIFQELHQELPNARLVIVGSGSLESSLRNRASSIGDGERVIFITDCHDASEYYSAMDCFLFPSLFEGFGIAALEAQCSGLCCAMSTGVCPDVVILDTTKRVSLNASAKEWAEAAIALLELSVNVNRSEARDIMMQTRFNLDNSTSFLSNLLTDFSCESK